MIPDHAVENTIDTEEKKVWLVTPTRFVGGMEAPLLEFFTECEVSIWILPELLFLFLGVSKVMAIPGLVGAEVDGYPGRIADIVDQPGHPWLHGRDTLKSRGTIPDDSHTLVGPIIRIIPGSTSAIVHY
jgi:hypothetical protein